MAVRPSPAEKPSKKSFADSEKKQSKEDATSAKKSKKDAGESKETPINIDDKQVIYTGVCRLLVVYFYVYDLVGVLGYSRNGDKHDGNLLTPKHVQKMTDKPSLQNMSSEEFLAYLAHSSRLVILVVDESTSIVNECLWVDPDLDVSLEDVRVPG